jgi:primosomal protein N' (replication factor Y)
MKLSVGLGTQRIEACLKQLFKRARILRLDSDAASKENDWYEAVLQRKYDILIGTQMVAKGLDFPYLTLVGVIQADLITAAEDFRSSERLFQLLVQVSGRAGRHGHQGKVIIQTFNPYHQAIRNVIDNDYKSMYESQITERRVFRYPPYYRLIYITLKHRDNDLLNEAANRCADELKQVFGTRVVGPEYPSVTRVRGLYIKNIMMRFERSEAIAQAKSIIMEIGDKIKGDKSLSPLQIHFDVDPQ